MFSVTNTGRNFLPLWTANVTPTISGRIVDRRDQVLMTFFAFFFTASCTFLRRCVSTNGPFLTLRAIGCSYSVLPLRRRTMNLSVRLFCRVLNPLAGWPHGLHGCRPPEDRPSPPPMG